MDDSFEVVNKSCLNSSSSKQLYSFSKQKRFRTEHLRKTDSADKFYSIPSIFDPKKKTGPIFSKSPKSFVYPIEKQGKLKPGPTKYSSDVGSIKESVRFKKGVTMGMRVTTSTKSFSETEKFPSPQSYTQVMRQYQSTLKKQPCFSFSKESKTLKSNLKGKDSPGSKYLLDLRKIERVYSNFESVKSTKIVKLREIFQKQKSDRKPFSKK